MDIRLVRRPHPNRMVRGSGITPTDPYLDWCWLPVVGPSTVALVRHVAGLTSAGGEARIPLADLSRLLGLGAADAPSRNNKLVRTMTRAEQFGLAFTSLGLPGEQVTFGIHDHVALVPARLLDRLPEVSRQRHVAAVDAANEALTAAGLPALRSAVPAAWRTPERPEAVPRTSTTHSALAEPRRALHAVPPIARLDASATAPTPAARALAVIPIRPLTSRGTNARRVRDERARDHSPAHSTRVPAHVRDDRDEGPGSSPITRHTHAGAPAVHLRAAGSGRPGGGV